MGQQFQIGAVDNVDKKENDTNLTPSPKKARFVSRKFWDTFSYLTNRVEEMELPKCLCNTEFTEEKGCFSN